MKNKKLVAIFSIIMAVITCALSVACLTACNPYSKDNNFSVKTIDGEDALIFEPQSFKYSYGVIFYVGTLVEPEYYSYLGEALAAQGYLTVIPKFATNMAYSEYAEQETAFEKYPNVKFFIGGHEQGGGAAIRRAQENPNRVQGVLLFSPLCFSRQVYDENGKPLVEIVGDDKVLVQIVDSIAETSLPVLWLESDDALRTDTVTANVNSRLNKAKTTKHIITNSNTLDFCTKANNDSLTEEQKINQRNLTLRHTLNFLKKCVK